MVNIDKHSLRDVVEGIAGSLYRLANWALCSVAMRFRKSSTAARNCILTDGWWKTTRNLKESSSRISQTAKLANRPVPESVQRSPHLLLIIMSSLRLATRGLRRGSAVARLLGLRIRIPPGAWMSVSLQCCVLSGRGLWIGLITRPEEPYRVWCVWVWPRSLDLEEALVHWRCWVMGNV